MIALVYAGASLKFEIAFDITVQRVSRTLIQHDHVPGSEVEDIPHRHTRGTQANGDRKTALL
jgi:hypothetical protein